MVKQGDAYRSTDVSQSLVDRVKAINETITRDPDYNGWDTQVLRDVKYDEIQPGKCVFSLIVTPAMCNKGGILHGGCASTILDNLTSITFITLAKEGFLDSGTISRTLILSFLRPVPEGTRMRIVCEAVSAGRTLAYCKGQIELPNGKVAVTCQHDKAVLGKAKL